MSGISIVLTTAHEDNQKTCYKALHGLRDGIFGCYMLFIQRDIKPVDRVPKHLEKGWNFGLYNTLNWALGGMKYSHLYKVKAMTSIGPKAKSTPWLDAGTIPTLTRVDNLLRLACKGLIPKLGVLKPYMKDISFCRIKACGKKPVGGVYHTDELSLLQDAYMAETKRFDEKFTELSSTNLKVTLEAHRVNETLAELHEKKRDPLLTSIMDTANARIPYLVTRSRNRKLKETTIVPGSSLPEKVMNAGITSMRDIAKILWSPLMEPIRVNDCIAVCATVLAQESKNPIGDLDNYIHHLETKTDVMGHRLRKNIAILSMMISIIHETTGDDLGRNRRSL
jgi:hypothetical protein